MSKTSANYLKRIMRAVQNLRMDLMEAPEVQFAANTRKSVEYALEKENPQLAFTISHLMSETLKNLLNNIEDEDLTMVVDSLQWSFARLAETIVRENEGDTERDIFDSEEDYLAWHAWKTAKEVFAKTEESGTVAEAIAGGWEVIEGDDGLDKHRAALSDYKKEIGE